jgi:preprotein translocase subunit SecA
LFVIGTERHESRRIDNQLRGRSGRQGDPGRSHFFLSLEDDLMRIFGSDRMGGMLQRLGLKEGEAIVHPWINKALEKAQKKVEARNFDTRKNVLKYDDVMNDQRKEVYAQRKEFMKLTDVAEMIAEMREDVLTAMVAARVPEKAFSEHWELAELSADVQRVFGMALPVEEWGREEGIDETHLRERLEKAVDEMMAAKAANMGPELMRFIERSLLIQTLDAVWKEHLYALDHLRQGIGLRAYGQRDPLNEYKSEAFVLFNSMLVELKERVTGLLSRVELAPERPIAPPPVMMQMVESHAEPASAMSGELALAEPRVVSMMPNRTPAVDPHDESTWAGTPRNAQCPCGSGKKYKHCHGRLG